MNNSIANSSCSFISQIDNLWVNSTIFFDKVVREKGFSVKVFEKKYTGYAFEQDQANIELILGAGKDDEGNENNLININNEISNDNYIHT